MTTGATGQLGLALPVQGELSGTWGDTVNNGITQYTNIAIAGTLTLTDDGAVTLANTTGDSSASNITSSLTGAGTVTAQFAIVKVTGTLTTAKVVTAPSYSKTYTVVNSATGGIVTFKASGQTGVSIAVGETAFVYFNGTDYVKVVGTATAGAAGGSNTQVQYNSSGVLAGSSSLTFDGTTFSAPNSVITSSSSSDALRITQTGAGNAILVEDEANPDSTPFVVDANGQVIVGNDSALTYASGVVPQLQVNKAGAEQIGISRFSADTGSNAFVFLKSRGATINAFDVVASGDGLGSINWYGADGTAGIQAASITSAVDGTPGTNDMPGRLVFSTTADGASSPTERMRITNTGSVGIGATTLTQFGLRVSKTITGNVVSYGIRSDGVVQSDVTSQAFLYNATGNTAASAFTLSELRYYSASQGSIGAGSSIASQYGFLAESNLTSATNNYGFYGNIASGTGRYNLYMAGTADNYMAGLLGIGTTTVGGFSGTVNLGGSGSPTSGYLEGWGNSQSIPSSVTTRFDAFISAPTTAAASFTLPNLVHFRAQQGSFGAGSVVTNQHGFYVDATLTGATNNFGFYSAIASGTGRWNFYAAGTAQNYFAGNVGIATTSPGSALDVKGTLRLSGSSSGYVGFAPAAAAGSTTYTLPSTDGSSGQFLSTNGSGTLSWASGGGGGGSAATPTALGTVYGSMTTSGASPYLTALGYNAGVSNTTGARNVFIGSGAGLSNITSPDNVAIGYQAMPAYTGADGNNIAIGSYALSTATTGSSYYNVAIGYEAMKLNTSGYNNVALGWRALLNNTSGRYSTAIGYTALQALQSGNDGSTAVGALAGSAITTGVYNVCVGGSALAAVTTGSYNTSLGYNALGPAGTTSSSNTAVGYGAMSAGGVKSSNTAIGRDSLVGLTTGSHNIGVGVNAGEGLTTGSSNIYIGSSVVYASSASVNNEMVIAAYTLQGGKGSQTALIFANSGAGAGGSYYNGANSSSWNTTSDQRIKKNIVDNNDGLNKINSIRVRNFEYRLPEEIDSELKASDAIIKSGVQLGVIAQELQQVLPECVKQETTGVYSVDSDNLTWYMINAIKELKAEFDAYKASHP